MIVLSVLYKGGLLMGSEHMTVGELTSFLMYAFWVGISIAGKNKLHEHTTCIIRPSIPHNKGQVSVCLCSIPNWWLLFMYC